MNKLYGKILIFIIFYNNDYIYLYTYFIILINYNTKEFKFYYYLIIFFNLSAKNDINIFIIFDFVRNIYNQFVFKY
jgi:hypothetical protein